jgi:hypothetical protein
MNYPCIVIDNFLSDPTYVRKFGLEETELSQNMQTPKKPLRGLRSCPIENLNEKIYSEIIEKIALAYPVSSIPYEKNIMEFQLTDGTWEGPGWVHPDACTLTCILYLNPNPCESSGTSLYTGKTLDTTNINDHIKKTGNKDVNFRKTEEYKKARRENNDQFIKTMQVSNVFNRMFVFPGDTFHSADSFFGNSTETNRLTIVTFVCPYD